MTTVNPNPLVEASFLLHILRVDHRNSKASNAGEYGDIEDHGFV